MNHTKHHNSQNNKPILSFGIPVHNPSESHLRQLLDSLLAQDFQDLEIVISDNASDKGTQEICEEYAQRDQRIQYFRNPENIGQIDNFNKVLKLATGKYFRWIGSDDWLEIDYARRCVQVLETDEGRDFIGITTYQDFILHDGQRHYREYKGERLDSPRPRIRFCRMVWFMTADLGVMDPIYTLMRRDVLLETSLLRHIPCMDQVLAIELSLLGSFTHIPICLSHRRFKNFGSISIEELHKQYSPKHYRDVGKPYFNVSKEFFLAVWRSQMSYWDKILCFGAVVRFHSVHIKNQIMQLVHTTTGRLRQCARLCSQ